MDDFESVEKNNVIKVSIGITIYCDSMMESAGSGFGVV